MGLLIVMATDRFAYKVHCDWPDDEEWEPDYFAEPWDPDRPGHHPKDEHPWDLKKPIVKPRPRPTYGRWSRGMRPYYIPGHANNRRQPYRTLLAAKRACRYNGGCGGVTYLNGWYELRRSHYVRRSPVAHETSWLKR